MRRRGAGWAAVLGGMTIAVGCKHTAKYDTEVPFVEEFKEPPHESRFDNPPEQGYQKPKAKKEFKPGAGAGGGPGMGGPGMGGGGFGQR
jgi:hypothetical protein